jgi:hypothetical protein
MAARRVGLLADKLRRLRAARATGRVPADLWPFIMDSANQLAHEDLHDGPDSPTPFERLGLALSAEIDGWMTRRGVSHRTISVGRRTLARALKGENVRLSAVADIADALGCDVTITFKPRA